MPQEPAFPLSRLPRRIAESLEPFLSVFKETVVLESVRRNSVNLSKIEIAQMNRKINRRILRISGHPFHPGITLYAFRLCCHHYRRASLQDRSNRKWEEQQEILDLIWGFVLILEEHNRISDLNLLIG